MKGINFVAQMLKHQKAHYQLSTNPSFSKGSGYIHNDLTKLICSDIPIIYHNMSYMYVSIHSYSLHWFHTSLKYCLIHVGFTLSIVLRTDMFGVGCWWFGTKRRLNLGSFGCILVKVGGSVWFRSSLRMIYAVNDLYLFNLWNALCPTDFACCFFYGKLLLQG